MNRLIINADDFGVDVTVTSAIANAFDKGYINQTTVMVNMPASIEAIEVARNRGFADKVGLHLNFSQGKPMTTPIMEFKECCDENGIFQPKKFGMGWCPFPKDFASAIEIEARAQIEKFLSFNLKLRHCDGHHHIHNRLPIAYIVLPILKEYGFMSVRNRYTPFRKLPRGITHRVKNKIFYEIVKKYGLKTTEFFGGWQGSLAESLKRYLSAEIMVHPNYNAAGLLVDVQDWKTGDGPELRHLRQILSCCKLQV